MATVEANGVTLGVEHFGDAAAPLVLLIGGATMLSWPDALCEALARGERVAEGVRCYIQCGSQEVFRYCQEQGYDRLFEAVGVRQSSFALGRVVVVIAGSSRSQTC